MRSTRWFAAALAVVGATAAVAGQWPDKAARDAAMAEVFAKADADGSGTLSAEELTTFHTLMRQRMQSDHFSRADANGDGQLTLEELQAARPPRGACRGGPPPEE
jgi:Ca2+-binding EF-hand superfamily protein